MPAADRLSGDALQIFNSALTLVEFQRLAAERSVETEGIPPLDEALSTDHLKDAIRRIGLLAVGDIAEMLPEIRSYTPGEKKAILLVVSTAREMLESDANPTLLVAPIVSTFGAANPSPSQGLFNMWVRNQCAGPDTFKNMIKLMVHQVMAFEKTGIRKEFAIERDLFGVYKSFKSTDYFTTLKAANTAGGCHDNDWSITIEHAPNQTKPWRLTVLYLDLEKARGVAHRNRIRQTAIEKESPGLIVEEWFADKAFQGAAKHACALWQTNEEYRLAFWRSFWGGEGKLVEKSPSQLIMGARPFVDVAKSRV